MAKNLPTNTRRIVNEEKFFAGVEFWSLILIFDFIFSAKVIFFSYFYGLVDLLSQKN